MAEAAVGAASYFMLDINCDIKFLHSGFINVDKYSPTVGELLGEEIPEGYLISKIFISESEGKMRRHVPIDMVFDKLVVHQH